MTLIQPNDASMACLPLKLEVTYVRGPFAWIRNAAREVFARPLVGVQSRSGQVVL